MCMCNNYSWVHTYVARVHVQDCHTSTSFFPVFRARVWLHAYVARALVYSIDFNFFPFFGDESLLQLTVFLIPL